MLQSPAMIQKNIIPILMIRTKIKKKNIKVKMLAQDYELKELTLVPQLCHRLEFFSLLQQTRKVGPVAK
jgi:hypothetical protein